MEAFYLLAVILLWLFDNEKLRLHNASTFINEAFMM